MVDGPEEACDDGNQIETDACLNSCTLRSPQGC
jgi:cysteine-rich repeat protein